MDDVEYPDSVTLIKRSGMELHGFRAKVGEGRIIVREGVEKIGSIDDLFAVRWTSPFGLEHYRVVGGQHRQSQGQADIYILSVKREVGSQGNLGGSKHKPVPEDVAVLRATLRKRFQSLQTARQMEICHARMKQLWAALTQSPTVQGLISELQQRFPNAQADEANVFTEAEKKPDTLDEAAAMYWWTLKQCGESPDDDIEWQIGMGVNRWSEGAETLRCFVDRFATPVMDYLDEQLEQLACSTGHLSVGSQTYYAERITVMRDQYNQQQGVQGPHAHAQNISFTQIWQQAAGTINLATLAQELPTLRAELRKRAAESDDPEQDRAVVEVRSAEDAAKAGDGPRAMEHLKAAGKWALDAATNIGTKVAAEALTKVLGMG